MRCLGRQAVRCIRLLRELERHDDGFTIRELRRWGRISRRQVYNDLDVLRQAGIELVSYGSGGPGEEATWRLKC